MKGLFKQYNYYFTQEQYKEIWENGLFVFDTNTLLNLYRYQEETRNEFLKVLDILSERIWLPHHVALEFQRNRLNVICEQRELFSKTKKAIELTNKNLNVELEKLQLNKRHSSIKVDEFTHGLKKISEDFTIKLNELKSTQQHISKPDALKETLEDLFDQKIGKPPKDQKELDESYKLAEFRYKNKIPPGYLDNEKTDICLDSCLVYKKKYGDFLVWKQILEHCKENKIKQLIFITNDLKEDWWTKYDASGEKFHQPRPELIDEALYGYEISNFIMYDSEQFLSYSSDYLEVSISEDSVKEVRDSIDIYNKDLTKVSLKNKQNSEALTLDLFKTKKIIAFEKVEKFRNQMLNELYHNKGIREYQMDILECPQCGLDTMIHSEISSTGYKCAYCENEESDEIEIECSMCGMSWASSEISHIEWTDEGHIEKLCPYCRHDPDYVKDD
ncbi:PIN-like domain-containing protein [Acinetobacter johnsonii]|uniref:PIN-like domain-containing protein n=1 Tax=Acinetobacter johnsonii TaxID=40214 RepID=UPI003017461A